MATKVTYFIFQSPFNMLSENKTGPCELFAFKNMGAQKRKNDFSSFGGLFKNGHISAILNFKTLIFCEILGSK